MNPREINDAVRVWAIVPAAGAGSRMGTPKQCLPWGDTTMAGTVVAQLLYTDCHGVVVITRTELIETLQLPLDGRIRIAVHDKPVSEMIDSIRVGLAVLAGEVPGRTMGSTGSGPSDATDALDSAIRRVQAADPADGVLVVPSDQPEIPGGVYQKCLDAYRRDPGWILVAAHAGVRGHPMIFPFADRAHVADLPRGLNELPARFPERTRIVHVNVDAVLRDVDTPDEYARGRPLD